MKIQIKNRFDNSIIYEYDCEDNTIAKTVSNAIKSSVDLSYADLRYADLSYADLRYADLRSADLRSADLRYADLRSADLRSANFSSANLISADLRYADFSDKIKIKKIAVFTGLYNYVSIPIIADDDREYIKLGCYTRLVSEWESDFWNNNSEFPNDGSVKSELRKMAYETCKKWLEINKQQN